MIEGIMLGFVTWLSFLLSWLHFPKLIKKFTKKHPFITDIISMGLAYALLTSISKSLIAAIGAVVTGLLVNFTIIGAVWGIKNGYIKDNHTDTRKSLSEG